MSEREREREKRDQMGRADDETRPVKRVLRHVSSLWLLKLSDPRVYRQHCQTYELKMQMRAN